LGTIKQTKTQKRQREDPKTRVASGQIRGRKLWEKETDKIRSENNGRSQVAEKTAVSGKNPASPDGSREGKSGGGKWSKPETTNKAHPVSNFGK